MRLIALIAAGHLASLCATRFGDSFPEEGKDDIDKQNCRPDFAIHLAATARAMAC